VVSEVGVAAPSGLPSKAGSSRGAFLAAESDVGDPGAAGRFLFASRGSAIVTLEVMSTMPIIHLRRYLLFFSLCSFALFCRDPARGVCSRPCFHRFRISSTRLIGHAGVIITLIFLVSKMYLIECEGER